MILSDAILATVADNLAYEQELLAALEADRGGEVLRIWEPAAHVVVIGRGTDAQREVNEAACRARGVEIVQRPSGGATVLLGPGCLMYVLVLDRRLRPELGGVDGIHRYVLRQLVQALRPVVPQAQLAGTSDLVVPSADGTLRKFSGNALRVRRHGVLYHGTLLYDFDLSLVPELLKEPPRQPDYRERRSHERFITNVDATRNELTHALSSLVTQMA